MKITEQSHPNILVQWNLQWISVSPVTPPSPVQSTARGSMDSTACFCLETFDLKPSKQYTHVISVKESNQS